MSDPADRHKSKSRRRFAEEAAAAEMVDRFMQREMAPLHEEIERLKHLFRLYGAIPRQGQALDTWIEEQQRKFTKGASKVEQPVKIYTKKYLKQQRRLAAAAIAKRKAAGVAVNEPLRKSPAAIPASAEAALTEWSEARKALEGPGERNLQLARLNRAETQLGVEMIKATLKRAPSSDPRFIVSVLNWARRCVWAAGDLAASARRVPLSPDPSSGRRGHFL
jgi:hypothetical protein